MIDIYDELGYIKNVLSNGLSQKWERDALLLARYYKMEGYSKSLIKETIKQKCLEASTRTNSPIIYNPLTSYSQLNAILSSAWRSTTPLRTIHAVSFPSQVLTWFLSLPTSHTLTSEDLAYYKTRRPSIKIHQNTPMSWDRVKYLFTLYIWTKIQENYLAYPKTHFLEKYPKRFKEDANLPQSFSMRKERDFLYDLGYIGVNYSLGVEASFIDKFPVFQTPLTPSNTITLTAQDPGEGDLYHPGLWLDKQRLGSFTCLNCGKEFPHYSSSKQEKNRKYCKECAYILKNNIKHQFQVDTDPRYRICEECGNPFLFFTNKNTRSCLCVECRELKRQKWRREYQKNYRKKSAEKTTQEENVNIPAKSSNSRFSASTCGKNDIDHSKNYTP